MQKNYPVILTNSSTTKEKIINLLSEKWPLTTKEIFSSLKKYFSLNISYQAIYKTIKYLVEEKILVKTLNGYSLSSEWIEKTKKFSLGLEEKYLKSSEYSVQENLNKEFFQLNFDTPMQMGRFLLKFLEECPNPKNEPVIFFWYHAWPIIAFSDEEIKRLQKIVKNTSYYILSAFDTPIDNITLSAFKEFGATIILEPQQSFDPEHIVIGGFVLTFFFDFQEKKLWNEMCLSTKDFTQFNLLDLIRRVSEKPFKITTIGSKNPLVAQELRKQITKYKKTAEEEK